MNEQTIQAIVEELRPRLLGRVWGKVFQLSRTSLAIDFRSNDGRYLFIAVEPNQPRLYMIARTVRELEKQSLAPAPFVLALRKFLSGATLDRLAKDEGERVVRLLMRARDAVGDEQMRSLVIQLTGRTSNLFLLDAHERILDAFRPARGEGQEVGEVYRPPASPSASVARQAEPVPTRGDFDSLSEALDDYYRRLERERAFDARAGALAANFRQAIEKRRKLRKNLERDLAAHGDAEEHRRTGDLLLANLANAERSGALVRLQDFYSEDAPVIELQVDENRSLQEEAAERFARYAKAKRAAQEIAQRLSTLEQELDALEAQRARLAQITSARDERALEAFGSNPDRPGALSKEARRASSPAARGGAGASDAAGGKPSKRESEQVPGARRYLSSDGYEILVGRGARDNDQLTFRVARSHDTWLHAADYPGSHVIIRNHQRTQDIPHRTLVEAAQLAAHFSQARKDAKVAVNYTQRKFLSKPKGAAPGLVRISSFRTLLVEPREDLARI